MCITRITCNLMLFTVRTLPVCLLLSEFRVHIRTNTSLHVLCQLTYMHASKHEYIHTRIHGNVYGGRFGGTWSAATAGVSHVLREGRNDVSEQARTLAEKRWHAQLGTLAQPQQALQQLGEHCLYDTYEKCANSCVRVCVCVVCTLA